MADLDVEPGYYWFRNKEDATTFIAFRGDDHRWYLPGIYGAVEDDVMMCGTPLGPVPRTVAGGGSIDQ